MKIIMRENVLDAAIARIEWLFDEFDTLYVSMSGGKDSTVVFNLCMEVAERRGRLPLKVFFLDQEAEWQAVIDYMDGIMRDPRVEPFWMQVPFRLTNSTSEDQNYLDCWAPDKEAVWMRPKSDLSYKENVFGTDRFHEMFPAIMRTWHPDEKVAMVGGVRAEESPGRYQALTTNPKYKHVTWAKSLSDRHPHWTFYPIYDWSYKDVWKFIHERKAPYCRIYDYMYQHGVAVNEMRVSSLHHQTAVRALYYLQEIEQKTWDRMVNRIGGIHVTRNLEMGEMFRALRKLPWMFRTWKEYRDHLLKNLITDDAQREIFRKRFASDDDLMSGAKNEDRLTKVQIATVLLNDTDFTKLRDFWVIPSAREIVKWKKGQPVKREYADWIPDHILNTLPLVKAR